MKSYRLYCIKFKIVKKVLNLKNHQDKNNKNLKFNNLYCSKFSKLKN